MEAFSMTQYQIDGKFGVGWVILGTGRLKRLSILRQHRGVDRKEYEEVVLL